MDVGVWCVDDLAEAKGASPASVLQSLRTLQSLGIVVCVQQSPLKYRHVNAWRERGIELSEAEMHSNGLLAQLKRFERYVVEILNMCPSFDVAKLYGRLKLFLQGANKCEWIGECVRCSRVQYG